MTKLLEAFDVITGQTLGFEAIEEVTAQINVAGSVFQKVKGERGQECGGSTSERKLLGFRFSNIAYFDALSLPRLFDDLA